MRAAGLPSLLIIMLLTLTAQAASLKSIMREMRATLRDGAGLARKLFEQLPRGSGIKGTLEAEASASDASKSTQPRFAAFIADAHKAAGSVTTAAQFKTALGGLVAQCRSCHDAAR